MHSLAVVAEDHAHPGAFSTTAASPAGFIFMCSGATKPDCYRHRVLGLPRGSLEAVSRIRRGAALFLYDFDTKHLYGPYQADSDGGADLVPSAFRGRFPAQVGNLAVLAAKLWAFYWPESRNAVSVALRICETGELIGMIWAKCS